MDLSKRYYSQEALEPMMKLTPSIVMLKSTPKWATIPKCSADWVVKQRRTGKRLSRRDRRRLGPRRSPSPVYRRHPPASPGRGMDPEESFEMDQIERYLKSKSRTLPVIACGYGPGDDEIARKRRKRRKQLVVAVVFLGLVSVAVMASGRSTTKAAAPIISEVPEESIQIKRDLRETKNTRKPNKKNKRAPAAEEKKTTAKTNAAKKPTPNANKRKVDVKKADTKKVEVDAEAVKKTKPEEKKATTAKAKVPVNKVSEKKKAPAKVQAAKKADPEKQSASNIAPEAKKAASKPPKTPNMPKQETKVTESAKVKETPAKKIPVQTPLIPETKSATSRMPGLSTAERSPSPQTKVAPSTKRDPSVSEPALQMLYKTAERVAITMGSNLSGEQVRTSGSKDAIEENVLMKKAGDFLNTAKYARTPDETYRLFSTYVLLPTYQIAGRPIYNFVGKPVETKIREVVAVVRDELHSKVIPLTVFILEENVFGPWRNTVWPRAKTLAKKTSDEIQKTRKEFIGYFDDFGEAVSQDDFIL